MGSVVSVASLVRIKEENGVVAWEFVVGEIAIPHSDLLELDVDANAKIITGENNKASRSVGDKATANV